MKFEVWKDVVSQSCYFKSRPELVSLEGLGGGNLKSWKTLRVFSGMKLGGKNKHKS